MNAYAEWLHAEVNVESDYVFAGEPFMVKIRVLGSVRPRRPDTSAVKEFIVEFGREEWNPSRSDTVFHYRFRARRPGTLHIPPIPVRGSGAVAETARITIRARPREETDASLQLELSDTDCYTGQRLLAHLRFRFRGDVRGFQFDASFLDDERLRFVLPTGGVVDRRPDGYVRARLNRMIVLAQWERWGSGDEARNRVSVPVILIPQQAGSMTLEAPGVRAQLVRVRRRKPQNLYVMAKPVTLSVRALPGEERPVNFSGLVGQFDLRAALDPARVRVGDPLTLTLTLTGEPYLYDLDLPQGVVAGALTADFQVSIATPPSTSRESAKDFHFTIRPRHAAVQAVAGIEYNSFDPESGRYVTISTEPVPLAVAGNRVLTASDAEGADPGRIELQGRRHTAEGGIAHNFEDGGALRPQGAGLSSLVSTPGRAAGLGVPLIVFLAAAALRRRRGARA